MNNLMRSLSVFSFALVFFTFVTSCEKDDDPKSGSNLGNIKIQYEFVFGSNALPWAINQTLVHPKTGDTLTFTEFAFYLSNIRLQKPDGTWWEEDESYHIICTKCADATGIVIKDIPTGEYVAMEYTLGVDSARNVSGAQTGALSPSNGMYWSWNTGYIMLKAEGQSPQSSDGAFSFHLGGFSGANNVVTPKQTSFANQTLTVSADNTPEVVFVANPARLWHGAESVSVLSKIHSPGPEATNMAIDFYSNVYYKEIR